MKNALPGLGILVLAALVLAGAQSTPPAVPATLVRTELYCGRVSPADWDDFLARIVTPRFPDGLTWYDTHGQWRNPAGVVTREDSCVLILIHAPTPEKDRGLREICAEFKTRYHQQSVLRVDQGVTASF